MMAPFFFALLLSPLAAVGQDAAAASGDPFDDAWDDAAWEDTAAASPWSGFAEAGWGTRTNGDDRQDSRYTLEELRLRIESAWHRGGKSLTVKADAGYDRLDDGWYADLRDLTLSFSARTSTDIRIGRQVLTWGTGDLVFLNDLFPKDFVSFFSGRDDEYLKAPGNTVRITHFADRLNVDFAWTPAFEPDRYLTGERFSFFSPLAGAVVAPVPPLDAEEPRETLANGEFALRLFRTVGSREYAVYGYRGYFKQPVALTAAMNPAFAPLSALGASLRRPAGPGLLNAEVAAYLSRDDRDGTNRRVPNSQLRALLGYEWEARTRFTVGVQYYLEHTADHHALIANSPSPQWEPAEYRQVITNRLTYRSPLGRYTWSLFTFLSPTDRDFYLRPALTWRKNDRWSLTAGANLFGGNDEYTFFGQLQDGSNVHIRLRMSY